MTTASRLTSAVLLASLVPPTLFAAYVLATVGAEASANGAPIFLVAAWLVGLAHLVVLGVPAFLYLNRKQRLRWYVASVLGLLGGLVPQLLLYPRRLEGYSASANWHGRYVEFYVNGDPTQYAWWRHGESCLMYALFGGATAFVMWCVWSWLGKARA
jgi:hypothetical protein